MTDSADAATDHCVLVGDRYVLLAREWRHGDLAGFTADQVYVRIDEYEDLNELTSNMRWPATTSEQIAEGIATGRLRKVDLTSRWPRPD